MEVTIKELAYLCEFLQVSKVTGYLDTQLLDIIKKLATYYYQKEFSNIKGEEK
jgi:hypothetical protein